MEPLKVRADQALKNFFVKKLHNVVDVLAQEDCHAKLDRPVLLFSLA